MRLLLPLLLAASACHPVADGVPADTDDVGHTDTGEPATRRW